VMLECSGRAHTDNAKARISAAARARHPFPNEIKSEIRRLSLLGLTHVAVAKKVGVSKYTVGRLINGHYRYDAPELGGN